MKAAFLDRDGVIIRDTGYISSPSQVELLQGVSKALKQLHDAGYLCIVISNQSGVARGLLTMHDVDMVNAKIDEELMNEVQTKIDRYYFCPHHSSGSIAAYTQVCLCRKPGTSLVFDAIRDFGIDVDESFFVGDRWSDIQCAKNLGMNAYQVISSVHDHLHPWAKADVSGLGEAVERRLASPHA